jgi:hypothetical protein
MTDSLIYPRPRNGDFEFHRFLHELQENGALFRGFLSDPDGVMSRFDLDESSRGLLKARDYDGMVARGIHPILVVQLQRRIEWGLTMATGDTSEPPSG